MGSVAFVPGPKMEQPGVDSGSATANPRLVTAAHQFEAAMMQEILGPLTKEMQGMCGLSGDAEDGVIDDGDGGPNQALTSFASEALGEALSERGGFGIASSVLKKLSRVTEKTASHAGDAHVQPPFQAHSGKGIKPGRQIGN